MLQARSVSLGSKGRERRKGERTMISVFQRSTDAWSYFSAEPMAVVQACGVLLVQDWDCRWGTTYIGRDLLEFRGLDGELYHRVNYCLFPRDREAVGRTVIVRDD